MNTGSLATQRKANVRAGRSGRVRRPVAARKASYEQSVRINISLPPGLDQRKQELCVKFSFPSFSDYVQARIRKDLGIDLAA